MISVFQKVSSGFLISKPLGFVIIFLLFSSSTSLSSSTSTSSSLVFACVRLFLLDLACFDCFHKFLQAFLLP
nr:MAG TPA: hypothetical protein [Caudoviricetes sp.]DAW46938.1 MAG TPA: hypothetical protein [Caudoviricetes sp.]